MDTEIRKIEYQLMKDLEAVACLIMNYGQYKAYQRSLAEKERQEQERKGQRNGRTRKDNV